MPPFVTAECANSKCKHKNRYDLAELKKDDSAIHKGTTYRLVETNEELSVTCKKCGQRFKIVVPDSLLEGGKKHGKIER